MNRFIRQAAIAMFALWPPACPLRAEIVVSVSTTKPSYSPGEAIDFQITARNTGTDPVVLFFDSIQAGYSLDDERFVYPQPPVPFTPKEEIPPNSSHTWTVRHKWQQYEIPLGQHTVVGRLAALGLSPSAPATFNIVEPTLPTRDFLINFDTLPDGQTPIRELGEYRPWGVSFEIRNSPRSEPSLSRIGGNGYLGCYQATFPPGFNLAADFQMPVRAVRAEVSGVTGATIRMVAKAADGRVLDTATSAMFPERGKFLPVSVHSDNTPIAAVEWWPSEEKSIVMVENVGISIVPAK